MGKRSDFERIPRDFSGEGNPAYSHGHNRRGARSAEYNIWSGIKKRTQNHNDKLFSYYGGRGIGMDPAWVESFQSFLEAVGPRPSPKHSIDRIDNDGDYESSNVRWATRAEQSGNRRNNIMVEHEGQSVCLRVYCDAVGAPYKRTWRRLKSGLSLEQAVSLPAARGGQYG